MEVEEAYATKIKYLYVCNNEINISWKNDLHLFDSIISQEKGLHIYEKVHFCSQYHSKLDTRFLFT